MATVIKEGSGGGGGAAVAVALVVIALLVIGAIAFFIYNGGSLPSAGPDMNINVEAPSIPAPSLPSGN